jgi:hypothetical protein
MAYDNNNSGILSKNERKESEKHPEYTGTCEVDGVEYWISAWVKEGKEGGKMAGKKFFSLSFNPKEQKSGGGKSSSKASKPADDDIPF